MTVSPSRRLSRMAHSTLARYLARTLVVSLLVQGWPGELFAQTATRSGERRETKSQSLRLRSQVARQTSGSGGAVNAESSVFGPKDYERKTGSPVVVSDRFTVVSPGSYTFRITNGGTKGQFTRVSSAIVTLNGVMVVAPHEFNPQVATIERIVPLAAVNELSVELRSQPGSGFTLQILGGSSGNRAPVADAGPDQTVPVGQRVQLDGSRSSDADGDPLTHRWSLVSRPAGSTATITEPTSVRPSFVVDVPGRYDAQLVVNDGHVDSAPDTVAVVTENSAPVANAGPDQRVLVGTTVTLDGTASRDVDGNPLTFRWTLTARPAGSAATLTAPTAVRPTFVVDVPGAYRAQLMVNDGLVDSTPDEVTVTTANTPPVANAGPDQTVFVGTTVTLDGSTSRDVDGDPLTFRWALTTRPTGSLAVLSDATAVRPTFVVDRPGMYVAQLVVGDGSVDSVPDTVVIDTQNSPPVADAGPDQSARVGTTITLDGSGSSDVDGNALTFRWTLIVRPTGSGAALSNPTAVTPTFVLDVPGTYVAQLIVNDGTGDGAPDSVTVTTLNSPPVAHAGLDQTATVGNTVTLDGTGSADPDGDPLTYQWSLTAVPQGSAAGLANPASTMPSFGVDVPGTYIAQLVVHDGQTSSAPDTVVVTTANAAPTANAGPDQFGVPVDVIVRLDGTGSRDPDGDPLTYTWSLIARPPTSAATLSDASTAQPTFTPDAAGEYLAQLIVSDGLVSSAPDTVLIRTNRPPTVNAGPDQVVAAQRVFGDKAAFVAATGASSATGPLPLLGYVGSATVGSVTISNTSGSANVPVALAFGESRWDLTPLLPGVDIAVGGVEDINVTLDSPAYAFGFDFAEHMAVPSEEGSLCGWSLGCVDSTFHVSLMLAGNLVGTFSFNAPNDVASFVGVWSVNAFDRVEIREERSTPLAGENDYFGEFYVGRTTLGTTALLMGSVTDDGLPVGGALAALWSQVSGPGSVLFSSPSTPVTTATFGASGSYVLRLSASDGELTSSDDVTIAVEVTGNRPPLARAGPDQTVTTGATVQLDGSSSVDPDGQTLQYAWTLISRPSQSQATVSGAITAVPSFVADIAGDYVVRLTVSDGMLTATDDVTITATTENRAPVVSAGADQVIAVRSPFAWWPGNGNADDASGHLRHGTAIGGVTFATGRVGQAFEFNGIDGRVVVPAASIPRFGLADLAVDAWIRVPPGSGPQWRTILGKEGQRGGAAPSLLLRIDPMGRLEFAVTDCGTPGCGWYDTRQPVVSAVRVDDNAFHHIVGVRHASGYDLYLDGQLHATRAEPARNGDNDDPLFIGAQGFNAGLIAPLAGLVDEVHLFDRALAAGDVAALYQAGLMGRGLPFLEAALLSGSVTDDGQPAGRTLTVAWSQVSGPGVATLESPGSSITAVRFDAPGQYTFRLTASDGELTSSDDVTVQVGTGGNRPPSITAARIAPHWTQLMPTGVPPAPRSEAGAVGYDSVSDRLILFGGSSGDGVLPHLSDVWVLTNASGLRGTPGWIRLNTSGGPVGRVYHSALYDPTGNRLIVYGGTSGLGGPVLGDVWVLANANGIGGPPEWRQLPAGAERAGHSAAYDHLSNRLIVYGGYNGAGDRSDVQVLVDANGLGDPRWVTVSPTGPAPPVRGSFAPAADYDPITNRLMLFGGRSRTNQMFNDVWVLANANGLGGDARWIALTPAGAAPAPRTAHSVRYDPNSNSLVVFGGQDQSVAPYTLFNDAWVLRHANGIGGTAQWERLEPAGALPPARSGQTAAFAAAANRLVVAAGAIANGDAFARLNDVWVLENATGHCTVGQPCAFQVSATDPDVGDALVYAFDAAPAGMTIAPTSGAIAWSPNATQTGNHSVTVRVTDGGGLFATRTFTATVASVAVPNLVGLAPAWAEAFIGAADLGVGTTTSNGGAVTLSFDSLPSRQGWTYSGLRGASSPVPESRVFSLAGSTLLQNSIGVGFEANVDHRYEMPPLGPSTLVSRRLPFTVNTRARVVAEEGNVLANSEGFSFGAFVGTGGELDLQLVGLGVSRIDDAFGNTLATGMDNSQFHDYSLRATPGHGSRASLFRDGALLGTFPTRVASGPCPPQCAAPNFIYVGDATAGTNARAEVTAYSFIQPRVVGQSPPPGTLVPNGVAVALTIVDGPATETVPSIIGVTQSNATAAITAANLVLGLVTGLPSATVPAGTVMDQSPLTGVRVPPATPVALVISTGPPTSGNQPPIVSAGPDQSVVMPAGATLVGSAVDDGLPVGSTLSYSWSQVSGPGVTSFSSPTSATTNATFSTAGVYVLRLTASDGQLTGSDDLVVTVTGAGAPLIVSVSPATAPQGSTTTVTITGQNTHFSPAVTQVSLGAGIDVSNIVIGSPTRVTAVATVAPTAAVGPRTVTLTTGAEVASLPSGFQVTPASCVVPPAGLAAWWPGEGNASDVAGGHIGSLGTDVTFAAGRVGQGFRFAGVPGATPGAIVTVPHATSLNATSVTLDAWVRIAQAPPANTDWVVATKGIAATAENYGLYVRSVGATSALELVFEYNPGTGFVGLVSSGSGLRLDTLHHVAVTADGSTIRLFVDGQLVAAAVQPEPLVPNAGPLYIGAEPVFGSRFNGVIDELSIYNPALADHEVQAIHAAGAAGKCQTLPALLSVTPNTGVPGQSLSVAIVGQNTHFAQGTTLVDVGSGISVTNVAVVDATHLVADLIIATGATPALRTVTVTTGGEVVRLFNAFALGAAGTPALVSVVPSTGTQGQQNLDVVITGQFTHFAQGVSTVFFNSATVAVNSVTVTSPTRLVANVSIALNASLVPRTVTVTTGAEVVQLANGFTVLPATNQAPVITIAPTWTAFALPGRLSVTYSVTDDGLPNGGGLAVSWQTVSGPGNVGFLNQTPTSVSVGFDQPGTYVLRIQATDTQLTDTEDITVTVNPPVPGPTVLIASPIDGGEVTGLTPVVGTVTGASLTAWALEMRMQGETTFRTLATGSTPVANAPLGTFDPTLLLNGIAEIQLTATDAAGQMSVAAISVVVSQNLKVGNFTVSFNDLTVPVAGLPVQVVRTYDSRDKRVGDFGVGWRLDVNSVTLTTNGALGDRWMGTVSGGLVPTYCIQPERAHVVTVTFSDGTLFQFQPRISPQCQAAPPSTTTFSFAPTGTTPPNVSLAIVGSADAFVPGPFPGSFSLLDLDAVATFDPRLYQLTMPDGRVLTIHATAGLQSMRDLNGNTLTVTPTGVSHSSGKSVTFQRDGQNRITRITDPNNNAIRYTYDGNGDLATVTDAGNSVTTFGYNATHGLLTIQDPRGVQPIRNEYDDNGRLIRHTDAFGFTIDYTHDLNNRQEIVRDRLGNVTVNEYDDRGNVVRVTDARGGVTTRTYDARNNVLTETNPLNQTRTYAYDANDNRLTETDPRGRVTTYTYNARNQVLRVTDPRGKVTTNVYNAQGNQISTTDPLGNTTTSTYDARGLLLTTTDPLSHVTAYAYDASGNPTRQTDALGHVTDYTYDANGNRRTETRTRTTPTGTQSLVTTFTYDALNRLTQSTFPDGSTTSTVYNAIGKQASTFDQLGRETQSTYDLMGRLVSTTFPDGSTEATAYDAEGRRTRSTDRAGRVTGYAYDQLGRLIRTNFPDGTSTRTEYDAAGQVLRTFDALDQATTYGYDAAGRRTSVTDALNHITTFDYDDAGNQTRVIDANGHVTQYVYDDANRRIRTVYHDGSDDEVTYDALGRTVTKTDQAGVVTAYNYDALGRLLGVVDANGRLTSYAYDEIGNRISQADALGRITRFEYDAMGRRVRRTLPLGMSETSTYNAAGNMASKTDFNGRTTTYAYDTLNRLTRKTPDPVLAEPTVHFSYFVDGQRSQMVDASGTTTYTYDIRGRLLTKATPQGTLTYAYHPTGTLASIRSSNAGGTSVDYAYDAQNRLQTVTDNRITPGVTSYTYDNAGSLATVMYPNGVTHTYTYNELNRLTNLVVVGPSGTLASYAYTLGPTGNRTAVVEHSGRQVGYTYDALYRLTGETVTVGGVPDSTTYTYDDVGNRLVKSSSTSGTTTYGYDNNDRLLSDTYDANGNTIASAGTTYTYDFENHLTGQNNGAVTMVYDGDGNRVRKTVGGVPTRYLVDTQNLTGYAQVLEEIVSGAVQRHYVYGLDLVSQNQASGVSFYGYDGHGSVRLLADDAGQVTDQYNFDAFGVQSGSIGGTVNQYRFSGERHDPILNLYHLRARYYSHVQGRFFSQDQYEGETESPTTLHKYLYGLGDPVNFVDPTGEFSIVDAIMSVVVLGVLSSNALAAMPTAGINGRKQVRLRTVGAFTHACQSVAGTGTNSGLPATIEPCWVPKGWPVQDEFAVTGLYREPGRPNHQGVDLRAAIGTNVYATADGTVHAVQSTIVDPAGKWVKIWHGPNGPQGPPLFQTRYIHLSEVHVREREQVIRGQVIGKSGNTSTEEVPQHLHYEIYRPFTTVDPLPFF